MRGIAPRWALILGMATVWSCTRLRSGTDSLPPRPEGGVTGGGAGLDAQAAESGARGGGPDASDAGAEAGSPGRVLFSGGYHTCAIGPDGTVRCWGDDPYAALGDGLSSTARAPQALRFDDGTAVTDIAVLGISPWHGCAMTRFGRVFCWGDQRLGETALTPSNTPLGQPDPSVPFGVTGYYFSVASAGWDGTDGGPFGPHSCAITSGGRTLCWGSNDDYALGHDPSSDLGYSAGDASVPYEPVPAEVVGLAFAQGLALFDGGGCALGADGTVQCWGSNRSGQLGDPRLPSSPSPVSIAMASQTPLSQVVRLFGGHDVVCALRSGGDVWCWGRADEGRLGLPPPTELDAGPWIVPPTPFAAGALDPIDDVAVGESHVCVVRHADGSVWCTGDNASGQLGTGDRNGQRDAGCASCAMSPVQVIGVEGESHLTGVTEISASRESTCAVTPRGVVCWGLDDHGESGHLPGAADAGDTFADGHWTTLVPRRVEGL